MTTTTTIERIKKYTHERRKREFLTLKAAASHTHERIILYPITQTENASGRRWWWWWDAVADEKNQFSMSTCWRCFLINIFWSFAVSCVLTHSLFNLSDLWLIDWHINLHNNSKSISIVSQFHKHIIFHLLTTTAGVWLTVDDCYYFKSISVSCSQ